MSVLPKKPVPPKWKVQFKLEVFQLDQNLEDLDKLKQIKDCLFAIVQRIGVRQAEFISNLRRNHQHALDLLKGLIKSVSLYAIVNKKTQDDEPCLDLWSGSIEVDESPESLSELIYHFTGPVVGPTKISVIKSPIGFLWKFVDENDDRFEKFSDLTSVSGLPSQTLLMKGFSLGNLINGTRFIEQFNSAQSCSIILETFVLNHTERLMDLRFEVKSSSTSRMFRLVYDYKSVKSVTISRSKSEVLVLFRLSHPPKISIATEDIDPEIVDMKKSKFHVFNYDKYRNCPKAKQSLNKESWTRWYDCDLIPSWCIGKSSVLVVRLPYNDEKDLVNLIRKFYVWRRYSALNINFGFIEVFQADHKLYKPLSDFTFGINYGLECIRSVSFAFEDDLLLNNQLDDLKTFITQNIEHQKRLIVAMYKLCNAYLYGEVHHALSKFQCIFKGLAKNWPSICRINSNPYVKCVRRVLLTPTRVLILPEIVFQSSQFLEIADLDCVLRLTICDEDMDDLGYSCARCQEDIEREEARYRSKSHYERHYGKLPSPESYFLEKCVCGRLLPSFTVAGKSFYIYGASSSQLREHGMVLYTEDNKGRDHKAIRNEIGQIRAKEISKYISRVGLSLTQVLAFVDLRDVELRYTLDVTDGKHPKSGNPYNFTDGCGLISRELAEYIWEDLKGQNVIKLEPDTEEKMPSAYQIRFMGCKGMIVVDETLRGKVIVLRESMRKMECVMDKLGIVKMGCPRRAYLNRPLITILNQIGLSNDFFVDLLYEAIGDLVDSFQSKIKASQALKMFSCLQRFINHIKLAELDYDLLGDPFFRSALNLVFHQALDVIKQKARIPLDMDNARTLFGVIDPTATHHLPYAVIPTEDTDNLVKIYDHNGILIKSFPVGPRKTLFLGEEAEKVLKEATAESFDKRKGCLKYGQVFIWPSDRDEPLTGDVLVTKFPCMHPGDVRVLEAVDIPELYGIRDCTVFPVHGHRPHSNEMAGSDFDGDEYCAIWSSKFTGIQLHVPMDFPDDPADDKVPINDQNIVKFFTRYIRDCAIGRIATTHLVWADMLPKGIASKLCLTLAEKYSISLDFVKTGISKMLTRDEKYYEAPDFIQNWSLKPCFHSTRALGAIHRTICMFELFLAVETSNLKIIDSSNDPRLEHPDCKKYEKEAVKQHEVYCAVVSHLLEITEFADEVELFTQLTEKSLTFGPNKVQRPSNHQDTMIYCVDHLLVKPMEENFYEPFKSERWATASQEKLNEAFKAKALAYYKISMKKMANTKKFFCGLPWIGKYSVHLFELLETSKVIKKSENAKVVKLNSRTVNGGFSVEKPERREAADSCWNILEKWLRFHLYAFHADEDETSRIILEMNELFRSVSSYYINDDRKKSPASVLRNIFLEIKSKRNSLNFRRNKFDSCNDPIGLMMVLVLEKKYYEGIAVRRTSEETSNCWSTCTYSVFSNDFEAELESMLLEISGCASIVTTPPSSEKSKSYKLSIFGSKASILICQVIIGLHNRLLSPNPHYQVGM